MPMSFPLGNILKINYEIRKKNHCRLPLYRTIQYKYFNIIMKQLMFNLLCDYMKLFYCT